MKIDIVGKGKVGTHLSQRFEKQGADLRHIDSRSLKGLRMDADLILIAVTDTAIEEVARMICDISGSESLRAVVAHVSGSTPIEKLACCMKRGVFYPFQSFSKGAEIDYSKVPLLLEADSKDSMDVLQKAAEFLGGRAIEADGEQRRGVHLAGVFGCNFLNEMLVSAFSILKEKHLPVDLIYPLVELTVAKALEQGPGNVRTGPAVRGDSPTIDLHLKSLADNPHQQLVYRAITSLIQHNSNK